MNRVLVTLTIIIGLIALYVGFKEPVTQTYKPIQIADSQSIQSAYLDDLKKDTEVSIAIEVPKEIPEDEPTEVFNEITEVTPEIFGFVDTTSNIFNQVILAGYYLKNCTNAQRAAELINGTVIQPGEMFSFNKVVGARTVSRGFVESRIIVGNRYEKGVGGGVCRTSTALYQVARQAGLQINEVHRHSLPIGYAKPGQDAAIWYGTMDLKITNNRDHPIKILTINADKMLYIAVAEQITEVEVTDVATDIEATDKEIYAEQEDIPEANTEDNNSLIIPTSID